MTLPELNRRVKAATTAFYSDTGQLPTHVFLDPSLGHPELEWLRGMKVRRQPVVNKGIRLALMVEEKADDGGTSTDA